MEAFRLRDGPAPGIADAVLLVNRCCYLRALVIGALEGSGRSNIGSSTNVEPIIAEHQDYIN